MGDATSSRVDRGSTLLNNKDGDQRDERWVYVYSIGVRDIDDARGKSEMVVADWSGYRVWVIGYRLSVIDMKQYSLSELCAEIQEVVENDLLERYWVRAEIASLSARGHCYLELVEKAEDNMLAAKVRATCWSNVYTLLSAYFNKETGQALRVGMQVLVEVSVTFHPVYGLSLNVWNIDPT